jgi:hypothetical protein
VAAGRLFPGGGKNLARQKRPLRRVESASRDTGSRWTARVGFSARRRDSF